MDLDGDVELASTGSTVLPATLDQTLPTNVTAGFGFAPVEGLTLGLSYQYEANSEVEEISGSINDTVPVTLPQNWSDSHTVHVGGEYWFIENTAVRAGYAKDLDNSIPDTANTRIIGDIAAHEVSFGLAHKTNQFEFGLTWNGRFGDRDIAVDGINNPAPGNYDAFVHSLSFGLSVDL